MKCTFENTDWQLKSIFSAFLGEYWEPLDDVKNTGLLSTVKTIPMLYKQQN